ncbi:noggin-3-like [Apostichopus japonicus]|uniref:noggin-3-like n=1 Tax=Stichopus japonicus TaxID=307972 RepID=UPI003AB40197
MAFRKYRPPLSIVIFCLIYFEGIGAPRPQPPLRPVLKASSDVPPSLPIIEGTLDRNELPKRKDLNETALRLQLGDEFDERWSSISQPSSEESEAQTVLPSQMSQWIEDQIANLTIDYGSEFPDAITTMSNWLTDRVTCPVAHEWVDIGPLFWPRWYWEIQPARVMLDCTIHSAGVEIWNAKRKHQGTAEKEKESGHITVFVAKLWIHSHNKATKWPTCGRLLYERPKFRLDWPN